MKLVMIEWVDSVQADGWQLLEPIEGHEDKAARCRSVGWLVRDGAEVKVLAPHMMDETDHVSPQVCGVMDIPVVTILAIMDLVEKEAAP